MIGCNGSIVRKARDSEMDFSVQLFETLLSWLLPVGMLVSPIVGLVMKKLGVSKTFLLFQILLIFWTIILALPNLGVQVLGFILFSIVRAFYYSTLCTYLTEVFGWKNFGRLYGIAMFIGGLFGLLQYGIVEMTLRLFSGDFLPQTIIQLVIVTLMLLYPIRLLSSNCTCLSCDL